MHSGCRGPACARAGLQVGDLVSVPGPGLRLHRAVLAGGGGGALCVDTLKNHRARTVPLVADLAPMRHTAASVWLGARADPKVVQRVLGHATAAMTMDLYGHLVDNNLWEAARAVGASWGHLSRPSGRTRRPRKPTREKIPGRRRFPSGAAYRNRTDDLRITSQTRVVHGRPHQSSTPAQRRPARPPGPRGSKGVQSRC